MTLNSAKVYTRSMTLLTCLFAAQLVFAQEPNYPNSMNYQPTKPATSATTNAPAGTANGGLGNCNTSPNTKDPNSVNNPFSQCGSPYAPNSIKNTVRCPLGQNCPNNPMYNSGLPSTAPQMNPAPAAKPMQMYNSQTQPKSFEIQPTVIEPTNPPQTNPF